MISPPEHYDLVVIGAGPAGSTAATVAAGAGLRTLVVEKERFPRFRIGESLLPHGNGLLREIGVWDKVAAAGFIEKFGARFHTANGVASKEIIFANGIIPGLEKTWQVERAKFDAILLDHARETGAEALLATTVTAVEERADGHLVMLKTAGGDTRAVSASWVIDAGGRDNLFPDEAKRRLSPGVLERRVAVYAHFEGVPREDGWRGGHTAIVRLDDGWFWTIPIDAARTSVGLVTTSSALRDSGLKPEAFFRHAVARHASTRALLGDARPAGDFHVTADYSYFRENFARPRRLLAGDAAGFFDPIFSSGVYLAMHSAREAARLVVRARRENRDLRPAERRRYTRGLKKHARVFLKLIHAFYDNTSFSVFMCPTPPLAIDRGVNSIVAGHSRLTWPIWWRFRLFLLVCRLQHRLPMVPRIDLGAPAAAAPSA
ncbi:MAG: NAD(P)/FAD-dependent oxidoreductase [Verrucomicrobiota bacterium]